MSQVTDTFGHPLDADRRQIDAAATFHDACRAGRHKGPRRAIGLGLALMALAGVTAQPALGLAGPLIAGVGAAGGYWLQNRLFPQLLPTAFQLGWLAALVVLILILPAVAPLPPGAALGGALLLVGALIALRAMAVLTGPEERQVHLEMARRLAAMPPGKRAETMTALETHGRVRAPLPGEDQ